MKDFERLKEFSERLRGDIYPEPATEMHTRIATQIIARMVEDKLLAPGHRVLDVGCGQGFALRLFAQHGIEAVGVTLGEDYVVCKRDGLNVREMDQSFLEFGEQEFDALWCRHSLEHSPFPLFTLTGFHSVLKPNGLLYVEVPAPDTACHHESNANHYSVFGKSAWLSLFDRSGFEPIQSFDIKFSVPAGPDEYWAFFLRRR